MYNRDSLDSCIVEDKNRGKKILNKESFKFSSESNDEYSKQLAIGENQAVENYKISIRNGAITEYSLFAGDCGNFNWKAGY